MATTTVGKAVRAARELKGLLEVLWAEREARQHVPAHELKRLETLVEDCAEHEAFADGMGFRKGYEVDAGRLPDWDRGNKMTIPAETIATAGETVRVEHRVLNQLRGKTIRRAVLNVIENADHKGVADLMIACQDGSAIQIEATGSVKVVVLP